VTSPMIARPVVLARAHTLATERTVRILRPQRPSVRPTRPSKEKQWPEQEVVGLNEFARPRATPGRKPESFVRSLWAGCWIENSAVISPMPQLRRRFLGMLRVAVGLLLNRRGSLHERSIGVHQLLYRFIDLLVDRVRG
jgi:hypothetical protein